jgi:hypothetical protein
VYVVLHCDWEARWRGRRNPETLKANVAWERRQAGPFDPERFSREIQPKLAEVPLAATIETTVLSRPYCAMIRRGERVPHARHWGALRILAG